jgi:N-acetylneuraminate synthase
MDNQMAMEPDDLKQLVEKCRMIQIAVGVKERTVLPEEYEQRNNMRRSIVAACNLQKGHVISMDDLYAKRPGTGLSPDLMLSIVGRTVNKDIDKDELILESDLV